MIASFTSELSQRSSAILDKYIARKRGTFGKVKQKQNQNQNPSLRSVHGTVTGTVIWGSSRRKSSVGLGNFNPEDPELSISESSESLHSTTTTTTTPPLPSGRRWTRWPLYKPPSAKVAVVDEILPWEIDEFITDDDNRVEEKKGVDIEVRFTRDYYHFVEDGQLLSFFEKVGMTELTNFRPLFKSWGHCIAAGTDWVYGGWDAYYLKRDCCLNEFNLHLHSDTIPQPEDIAQLSANIEATWGAPFSVVAGPLQENIIMVGRR
jgi:hypothetical protein